MEIRGHFSSVFVTLCSKTRINDVWSRLDCIVNAKLPEKYTGRIRKLNIIIPCLYHSGWQIKERRNQLYIYMMDLKKKECATSFL